MKTPVALLNLWHQPARTIVSASGVTFALLLVFTQLGFQGAVSYTATNTIDRLSFDLMIRSVHYAHLFEPDRIDRSLLMEARNTPGVQEAVPFWTMLHNWQRIVDGRPSSDATPIRPIAVMGISPDMPTFRSEDINTLIDKGQLQVDDQLLIDDLTQAEYEPRNGEQFSDDDLDTEAEIGGKRFRISGIYHMGTGLSANGSAIVSDRGFAKISPWNPQTSTSLGLIQVAPGEELKNVQQQLQERFPSVAVMSRDEVLEAERWRWLRETPIGLIFQLGVAISLVVGAAIVYMVLATDVTEKLPEYATLLAMGYSRFYLAMIVMTQAVLLAVLGFLCAWLLAVLLYRITTDFSGIVMSMDSTRIILVFVLGLGMCCLSGLLAMRKLLKAEPANLF